MTVVPHGVIRVCIDGQAETFLVHEFHWSPVITVIDARGSYWTIPARHFRPATPAEARQFWLELEHSLHHRRPNSQN